MKRFLLLMLAVVMAAAVLCACGENKKAVKTTVEAAYDDGYAADYASGSSKDSDGNTVYEFDEEGYNNFIRDYNNTLSRQMTEQVSAQHEEKYGEYIYINVEKNAVIVGVHPEEFDQDTAQAEADSIADYGRKYFKNVENPSDSFSVIYCDANDQSKELAVFDYKTNE